MDDDDDADGRDSNGRWKKGYCPNPKGRPPKQPKVSQADVYEFKETLVDAVFHGKPMKMTRHELLLQKMFEQALKGSVLMQRKLFDRFEHSDETYQKGLMLLGQTHKRLVDHIGKTGELHESLYEEYSSLYYLIHRREHYEVVNEPVRLPRNRSRHIAINPNWRRRPKPQAILDLERQWAEDEAAEKAARAKTNTDKST